MLQTLTKKRGAFTLVEIMIVATIIAFLAAIAVPNFLRARKRSQALRVLDDLRLLDGALDQYAIDHNKTSGAAASFSDLQVYVKTGTWLYNSNGNDIFGNPYNNGTSYSVDAIPRVNSITFNALSDIATPDFWSPFY